MIRIAQDGWNQTQWATTLDEVTSGVRLRWIEIDGVRFPSTLHLISATVTQHLRDFQTTVARFAYDSVHERDQIEFELELSGAVEIVYLGKDGEEL